MKGVLSRSSGHHRSATAAPIRPAGRVRGRLTLAIVLALVTAPARAETWSAVYDAYVGGANAMRLSVTFRLDPAGYAVDVQARTLGLIDLFLGSRQSTQVDGTWQAEMPRPRQFRTEGLWKGERRATLIDYDNGQPTIRNLIPPETEREPVPAEGRQGAWDRVSPLAYLVRQVARTGRCDGTATTYDGRRVEETQARTVNLEDLPAGGPGSFAGRALRCDVALRMTAGFAPDEDRAHAGRVRQARVWIAAPVAGAPPLPVRISLEVGWLGHATVFLSDLHRLIP